MLLSFGTDVNTRAKAAAAAGSDARMSGCTLPVMINSGSGNQGMTVSLPVIEFAKEWKKDSEIVIKALNFKQSYCNTTKIINWIFICLLWCSKCFLWCCSSNFLDGWGNFRTN